MASKKNLFGGCTICKVNILVCISNNLAYEILF